LANERAELLDREKVRKNKERIDYLSRFMVLPAASLALGVTGLLALSSIYAANKVDKRYRNSKL